MPVSAERPCRRCRKVWPREAYAHRAQLGPCCAGTPSPSAKVLQPRKCFRCHAEKPPEAFPYRAKPPRGKTRKTRHRSTVCRACRRREYDQRRRARLRREANRATWAGPYGVRMRRCSRCHGVAVECLGHYVEQHRPGKTPIYHASCKRCSVRRVTALSAAKAQDPALRAEVLAKRAEYRRRYREQNRDAYLAAQRRYRERLRQDPERHARHLENTRIAYRLRQERKGKPARQTSQPPKIKLVAREEQVLLPAAPLAAAVERAIASAQGVHLAEVHTATGGGRSQGGRSREDLCAKWGISSRTLRDWREEPGRQVQLATADRVLTATGLLWHDVYDPAEHPEVAAVLEAA